MFNAFKKQIQIILEREVRSAQTTLFSPKWNCSRSTPAEYTMSPLYQQKGARFFFGGLRKAVV